MNQTSDALIARVSSATGSPGLTVPIHVDDFNEFQLYPGRILDVRVRTTAADAGAGLRRRVASVNLAVSPPTVTFDTAAQNGGGSGALTFAATDGLYLENTYSPTGPTAFAMAGIGEIRPVTGTFQDINRATIAGWRGIDGRAGATAAVDLDETLLDAMRRRLRISGMDMWTFGLGDQAVIDRYSQNQYSFKRISPEKSRLSTGFEGIDYLGKPLIGEDDHKRKAMSFLNLDYIDLYAYKPGPDWLDDDGAMWRRYDRGITREAVLVDFLNMGFLRMNVHGFLDNLNPAA
jgi:hypothetical protein